MYQETKKELNTLKSKIRSICSDFTTTCEHKLNKIYELVREDTK